MKRANKSLFSMILMAGTASLLFLMTSCGPEVNIQAYANEGASFSFQTGFSEKTTEIIKSFSGTSADMPLFTKESIGAVLKAAGVQKIVSEVPSPSEIFTSGTVENFKEVPAGKFQFISRTKNSLTLTLGPEQINRFYNLSNEESKSYLDLLMIPSITGEKLDVKGYKELLESVYGPELAEEIVSGQLKITLLSQNGKSKKTAKVSLGELLTSTKDMTWTVTW